MGSLLESVRLTGSQTAAKQISMMKDQKGKKDENIGCAVRI